MWRIHARHSAQEMHWDKRGFGRVSVSGGFDLRYVHVWTTIVAALVACRSTPATDQELDQIKYKGEDRALIECPLIDLWIQADKWPSFDPSRTSNNKGFSTTWEVRDDRLYLVAFEATKDDLSVAVSDFLPGRKVPLLAEWYSGTLQIPLGDPIGWPTGGSYLDGVFARVDVLEVVRGVVIRTDERQNAKVDWRSEMGKVREPTPISREVVEIMMTRPSHIWAKFAGSMIVLAIAVVCWRMMQRSSVASR